MKRAKINTHLTLEARLFIEEELNKGSNITYIATSLNRDRSNIAREIIRNGSTLMRRMVKHHAVFIEIYVEIDILSVIKLAKNLN